jgi:hypothetical protein
MKQIDKLIADLQKRYDELRPALEEARRIETAMVSLQKAKQVLDVDPDNESPVSESEKAPSTQSARISVVKLAEEALRSHGGVVRANELLELINKQGHNITQPVLASALRRNVGKVFKKRGKGKYTLIDQRPRIAEQQAQSGVISSVSLGTSEISQSTAVLDIIEQHHDQGISPPDMLRVLEKQGHVVSANYLYTILGRFKDKGKVRRIGRKYFPVQQQMKLVQAV